MVWSAARAAAIAALVFAASFSAARAENRAWGNLEPVAFFDEVVKRAARYGVAVPAKLRRCSPSGCEFAGDDGFSLTIDFHRSIRIEWLSGSGKAGPITMLAAAETLLQDTGKAMALAQRVSSAISEKPEFSSFEASGYNVSAHMSGRVVSVRIDPTQRSNDYRPAAADAR